DREDWDEAKEQRPPRQPLGVWDAGPKARGATDGGEVLKAATPKKSEPTDLITLKAPPAFGAYNCNARTHCNPKPSRAAHPPRGAFRNPARAGIGAASSRLDPR